MKDILYTSPLIEVRSSPLHDYGVFANRDIEKGETIEECVYFTIDFKVEDEKLNRYVFRRPYEPSSLDWMTSRLLNQAASAIVLGFGSIYNHSKKPNINYVQVPEDRIYKFFTIKPVTKDEELCHNYNSNWSKEMEKENG